MRKEKYSPVNASRRRKRQEGVQQTTRSANEVNSRIERRQTKGRKESDNEENNPKNTTTVRKTSKDKPGRNDTRNGIDAAKRNQTPKSQKGMRPRASGPQTWRWVWVPQGGAPHVPGVPNNAIGRSRVVRGGQCGGRREEGGWEGQRLLRFMQRQMFPGSWPWKAIRHNKGGARGRRSCLRFYLTSEA